MTYILENIHDIGIRSKYRWVKDEVPIFLIMDNDGGGHGTDAVKLEYEMTLVEEYNVLVDWQVPNSPESNMLDLGAWMAVQSEVKYEHKHKVIQADILSESINSAFWHLDEETIVSIHNRWTDFLNLMIKGNEDNSNIESNRGKKTGIIEGRIDFADIENDTPG